MYSVRLSLCSWKKSRTSAGTPLWLLDGVDSVTDGAGGTPDGASNAEAGVFLERDGGEGGWRVDVAADNAAADEAGGFLERVGREDAADAEAGVFLERVSREGGGRVGVVTVSSSSSSFFAFFAEGDGFLGPWRRGGMC